MNKYLVGISTYNEGQKIARVIQKFNDYSLYDVLIVDDGSTDHSLDHLVESQHFIIIKNEHNQGVGYTVKQTIDFSKEKGYEAVIFVSGNDKDDPNDVVKLIEGIEQGDDFVQGSRYLPGGGIGGDMPFYRKLATRIYPLVFSLMVMRKVTDFTNGFRAIRTTMFNDHRIDINQPWLYQYELEPYLFFKAVKLGYKVIEVPVRKIYPKKEEGYTKMKPFSGWWSILRPIIFLGLGIKK